MSARQHGAHAPPAVVASIPNERAVRHRHALRARHRAIMRPREGSTRAVRQRCPGGPVTRSVGVGSGALPRSLSDELISRPVVAAAVVSTGLLVAGEMDTHGAMHVLIGPAAGHSAAVCEVTPGPRPATHSARQRRAVSQRANPTTRPRVSSDAHATFRQVPDPNDRPPSA